MALSALTRGFGAVSVLVHGFLPSGSTTPALTFTVPARLVAPFGQTAFGPLDVAPAPLQLGSLEKVPLAFDFATILGTDTIVSSTATLTDEGSTHALVTSINGPTLSGTKVIATLFALTAGGSYRLVMSVVTAQGRVWEAKLEVRCPF